MEEYPRTVQEFEEKFASEQACIDYLFRIRWPEGFRCPRCGHEKFWALKRGLYRCTSCDLPTSITAGTIFQDTRKPLKLWLQAIWYITNQKHQPHHQNRSGKAGGKPPARPGSLSRRGQAGGRPHISRDHGPGRGAGTS